MVPCEPVEILLRDIITLGNDAKGVAGDECAIAVHDVEVALFEVVAIIDRRLKLGGVRGGALEIHEGELGIFSNAILLGSLSVGIANESASHMGAVATLVALVAGDSGVLHLVFAIEVTVVGINACVAATSNAAGASVASVPNRGVGGG